MLTRTARNIPTQSLFRGLKVTLPVSDFINDRLYHPKGGYFSKTNNQLGYLKEPIPFQDLFGYEDYTKVLHERYPENAWLTPSEIFKPYYGMSIANYIDFQLKQYEETHSHVKNQSLKIIEGGAGNGSAASSILNYFKLYRPKIYKNMNYKIVEISQPMVDRCKTELRKQHGELLDRGQIEIVRESIVSYPKRDNDIVFVLLLEVLDNMPHDRVYWVGLSKSERRV